MDKIREHLADPDWWFTVVIVGAILSVVPPLLAKAWTSWWSHRRQEATKERAKFELYLSTMGDKLVGTPELLGPMLQLAGVWRSRAWDLAKTALTCLFVFVLTEVLFVPRNWVTVPLTTILVVWLSAAIYQSLREAGRCERIIDKCAHALRRITTSRLGTSLLP